MKATQTQASRSISSTSRALVCLAGSALAIITISGCGTGSMDSFIDPSVTGRWEATPVSVPILDRLVVIEGPQGGQAVETSSVRPDDLIPEPVAYRVGPGDAMEIKIQDFDGEGRDLLVTRVVDARGYLDVPGTNEKLLVDQMNQTDIQAAIASRMRDTGKLTDPQVTIVITAPRRATFNVIGAVSSPGLFSIPRPDYRLLEALTAAGRFSESVQSVYVIRQIPLSPRYERGNESSAATRPAGTDPATPPSKPTQGKPKDSLIDLIDELSKPAGTDKRPPSPAVFGGGALPFQPESAPQATRKQPPEPIVDIPDMGKDEPATDKPGDQPVSTEKTEKADKPSAKPASQPAVGEPDKFWVFRDGKWVQVSRLGIPKPTETAGTPSTPSPQSQRQVGGVPGVPTPTAQINPKMPDLTPAIPSVPDADKLVTQRVIEVPLQPLLQGSAAFNIVVHPGDVIRLPSAPEGLVYVTGEVNRPGPYSLPATGKMTLRRAIVAAGKLSSIAIPERVDITRMIGPDRQATVMVNLRAIEEGTSPDIVLKNDDIVNVGTNFWALPLAVVRNGFRASYGFGFILDRNFQGDVFGADQATQGAR